MFSYSSIEDSIFDKSLILRFVAFVQESKANSCWIWLGARDKKGYGRIKATKTGPKQKSILAHRLGMMLYLNRIIKPSVCVLHNCPDGDNPSCVNPKHLWLGSKADNNWDRVKKGRHRPNGLRGTGIACAKLTEETVLELRALRDLGWSYVALGERFGIDSSTARDAALGLHWRHV